MAYLLFRPVPLTKSLCQESEDSNGLSLVCLAIVKNVFFTYSGGTPCPPPLPSPPPKKKENATLLQKYFFHAIMCVNSILVEICMLVRD